MIKDVLIIIRSVGERTESVCKQLILEQGIDENQIVVLNEIPFTKALEKTFEIGIKSDKKWTFVFDADVLCCSNSINIMLSEIKKNAGNTFEIQGYVLDKFFGGIRTAGNHLYHTEYFKIALEEFFPLPEDVLRPESYLLNKMAEIGYSWIRVPILVGIHDFEQSYEDIYRKSFIHGRKSLDYTALLIDTWHTGIVGGDKDFEIALEGFSAGLKCQEFVGINKNADLINLGFKSLKCQEKKTINKKSFDLKTIDMFLNKWSPSHVYLTFSSKLKTEFLFKSKCNLSKKIYIKSKLKTSPFWAIPIVFFGYVLRKFGEKLESFS